MCTFGTIPCSGKFIKGLIFKILKVVKHFENIFSKSIMLSCTCISDCFV